MAGSYTVWQDCSNVYGSYLSTHVGVYCTKVLLNLKTCLFSIQ